MKKWSVGRNEHRYQSVIVRDARQEPAEMETPAYKRRRFSRKTWCKGVVGRKHDLKWETDHRDDNRFGRKASENTHLVLRCQKCGKHLGYCWGSNKTWSWSCYFPKDAPPCPVHGVKHER